MTEPNVREIREKLDRAKQSKAIAGEKLKEKKKQMTELKKQLKDKYKLTSFSQVDKALEKMLDGILKKVKIIDSVEIDETEPEDILEGLDID